VTRARAGPEGRTGPDGSAATPGFTADVNFQFQATDLKLSIPR